jgi:non-specific serine/threonine protein kinase
VIGKKIVHYEVIDLLGRGGMGEVYRARDTKLDREVALKFLPEPFASDKTRLRRFRNEAKALATLHHPHVAAIFGIEESDEACFLVMELVEGQDLQQVLKDGAMEPARAVELTSQICEGLEAAHAKGLVHRDLKPANIKIGSDGKVTILDFGLAKMVQHDSDPDAETLLPDSADALTKAGSAVGTVHYMAPEQALGKPTDARSDLFALGAVVYEMLTGRRAFDGVTPAATFDAILHGHPEPADRIDPRLPRELVCVVESALQKDPQRRPRSAREFRDKLLAVDLGSAADRRAPSIAVLPFVNMSADPENEFFTDGLCEEILSSLARIENLDVASRTSSFAFKGKQVDIREIARILQVEALLEGSVRKSGSRLRISVQLVKADDGYQLWSERFDREMQDVFEVQDEIAQSIASALRVVLSPKDEEALRRIPTRSAAAYEAYLQAKGHYQRFGKEKIQASFNLYRKATRLDPSFVLAWLGVAECALWFHLWHRIEPEHLEAAEEAAARLMELAPDRAEAHLARGMMATLYEKPVEAEEAYLEAVRIDPDLFEPHYFLARLLFHYGRLEDAATQFRCAMDARSEDYQAACLLVGTLDGLGREEEARQVARETVPRLERALELNPADTRALSLGASILHRIDEPRRAVEWTRLALELEPTDSGVLYNAACSFARVGEIDAAIDALSQNIRQGWGNPGWLQADSDMDPLRDDPRFQELLAQIANR